MAGPRAGRHAGAVQHHPPLRGRGAVARSPRRVSDGCRGTCALGGAARHVGGVVELGGIEPPSAKRSPTALRPFPSLHLYGWCAPGWAALAGTGSSFRAVSGLSLQPAVSPAVHHDSCCRAVVVRPRVPLLVAVSLLRLTRSGGESVIAFGGYLCALFKESEQLRSHDGVTDSTSKPVSPVCWCRMSRNQRPSRGRTTILGPPEPRPLAVLATIPTRTCGGIVARRGREDRPGQDRVPTAPDTRPPPAASWRRRSALTTLPEALRGRSGASTTRLGTL